MSMSSGIAVNADLLAGAARKLKPASTLVTRRDGSKFQERCREGISVEVPQSEEERAATRAVLCSDTLSLRLEASLTAAITKFADRQAGSLRVITWNIWFDPRQQDERLQMLLSEAMQLAPDAASLASRQHVDAPLMWPRTEGAGCA